MSAQMLIVGSGPAGVACAKALLKARYSVTILDAGIELEQPIRDQLEALAQKPRQEWQNKELNFLRSSLKPTVAGIPLKTSFGSDYTYRGTEADIPLTGKNVAFKPSFATGGLSTVWGAAVLPFSAEDIADWPVSITDLGPHYRASLEWMPL